MVVVAGVVGSLLAPVSMAAAAGPDFSRKWSPTGTALPQTKSVKGAEVAPVATAKPKYAVPPTWQPNPSTVLKGGSAEVRLGASPPSGEQAKAGKESVAGALPVALTPIEGSSVADESVRVAAADPKVAVEAGLPGYVFSLSRERAGVAGPVRVAVDVGELAEAYGADWASRVHLVALPGCSLTDPQKPECRQQTPIASKRDASTGKVTAEVSLPGAEVRTQIQSLAAPSAPISSATVLAAVATPSGGAGDYTATPLSSSQAWTAGSASGSFTYSYPVQVPPALGGAAPAVSLSYDSASVDGKTSATNSQASWVGDGWEYSPGFIERTYKPCAKAGIANSGDQCWAGANLTISLAGHSGELVPDDTSCKTGAAAAMEQSDCTWRLKGDDGSKVQFLTGASNGTWNGSFIKLTDTGGTIYYFGLAHLPDANGNPSDKGPDTGSAWTVPVFSPNSGDPCYDAAKGKASWCRTAWRWNLDHVVDPHGNLTTYTYTPETNYYGLGGGQNNGNGTNTPYTRGGVLKVIGYGQLLSDQIAASGGHNPAAKVVFDSGERCVSAGSACDAGNRNEGHATDWPDVPLDQQCQSTGSCANYSPTYWTSWWLNSITTQVRFNGSYQDVDQYKLDHRFVNVVNTTESTRVPWFGAITRTGKDQQATGADIRLPKVEFTEMLLSNRVDGTNLVPSRPMYNRPRIQLIATETGGTIGVDYYPADCSRVNNLMPRAADDNDRSCYNVKWRVPGPDPDPTPVDDWFQRYPVKSVTLNANTPGSVAMTTEYTYGTPAWHRNDSLFVENKDRTWDGFRGYSSVTTVKGSGQDGDKSRRSVFYHQGMHGDITSSGAVRNVQIAGPNSGPVTDYDWLSGRVLEEDSYSKLGGNVTSYTVNRSSGEVATANHKRTGLPDLVARYGETSGTSTVKSAKADGSWRTATTTTTTDPSRNNRLTTSLSTADDLPEICSRPGYVEAPDPQVTALVAEQLSVSGANSCTAAPNEQNTVSWARTYYDGKPFKQSGKAAEQTTLETLDKFNGSSAAFSVQAVQSYDQYGRMLSLTDPSATDSGHTGGSTVTTAYTASGVGELPSSMSVTTPAPVGAADQGSGRTTVTVFDTARGLTRTVTDPNNRTTRVTYDRVGRTLGVWGPGRSTSDTPTAAYSYSVTEPVISADGRTRTVTPPSISTTSVIGVGPNYQTVTSTQIMDGLGRVIQTQTPPAVSAYTGRLLADTFYDSFGRVVRANNGWYNDTAGPSTKLYQTTTQEVPNQTYTEYDGQSRPVKTSFVALGVVQSAKVTSYPGVDRTDVTPPTGTTSTSTVTNARGQTTQLWQYKTTTATGNPADADISSYTYGPAGQLVTRKDVVGNTWTYGYDVQGRQVTATDPDAGTTTKRYDGAGQLVSTTDARGQSLTFTYDLLGRNTATYDGLAVDPARQRTARTYDKVLKGQPSESTRYVGGRSGTAYTSAVLAYDGASYRPTKSTITIPGSDIGSPNPYVFTYQATYDQVTGLLVSDNRSKVGNIASETVNYRYEKYGLLDGYGTASTVYDLSNDYDAYGRPVRTRVNPWGTQIVATNTYDESTGRSLAQYIDKQTAATGAVQQTTFAYDASGRITAVRTIPNNTPSATDLQCFTYDYLNRLATVWSDTGALAMAPQPAVGGRGACANATPTSGAVAPAKTTVGGSAPYWQDYTYDLTGNRKSLTNHHIGGDTSQDVVTTQTFPVAGSLNDGSGSGGPHALTGSAVGEGSPSTTYSRYDAAGNATSLRSFGDGTTTLNWSPEGKLDTYNPPVQIQGVAGLCLDTRGGTDADGTLEQVATCHSGGGQKFNTSGNLLKTFNKCVTAMGTTTGSQVQLQWCDGRSSQTWTTRADGTILNGAANLCLTAPDNATSGTALTAATCTTGPVAAGQKWNVPNKDTTYVHDADGNLLVRRNPGKTTITLGQDEVTYDTTTVPATTTGTRYYTMPGGLTLVREGTKSTYQITDHHNTANLSFDATTLAESRRPTDPFGQPRGTQPGTWAGTKGFVGGTKDDTTKLTNLGARQYQTLTGRFLSPDPIIDNADPQQWNPYAYSDNDPINKSDPSGLKRETDSSTGCARDACVQWAAAEEQKATEQAKSTGRQAEGSGFLNYAAGFGRSIVKNIKEPIKSARDVIQEGVSSGFDCITGSMAGCKNNLSLQWSLNPNNPEFGLGMVMGLVNDGKGIYDGFKNGQPGEATGDSVFLVASFLPPVRAARAARLAEAAGKVKSPLNLLEKCLLPHSFLPGTLVLMADGTMRAIEKVSVGDAVLAANPQTGETGKYPVAATITTPDDQDFTDLSLVRTGGPEGEVLVGEITSTQTHRFWNVSSQEWTEAADLRVGDEVLQSDGRLLVVKSVKSYRIPPRVAHDLTISAVHAYYVLANNAPVLVHNDNGWRVPDDYIVVRGGSNPDMSGQFSTSFGRTLEAASAANAYGKIRWTTAGEIRAGGGKVDYAPEPVGGSKNDPRINYNHANVELGAGGDPFSDPIENPVAPGRARQLNEHLGSPRCGG
ncbi:ricin-type beta-trefoil lectin domain protein [Kitasatospora sp. NPDC004289]